MDVEKQKNLRHSVDFYPFAKLNLFQYIKKSRRICICVVLSPNKTNLSKSDLPLRTNTFQHLMRITDLSDGIAPFTWLKRIISTKTLTQPIVNRES